MTSPQHLEHTWWLHDFLTARGWTLSPWGDEDTNAEGYPVGRQPWWVYPSSFGGERPAHLQNVSPEPLFCFYSDDGGPGIDHLVVVSAGAAHGTGCPEHRATEHNRPPHPDPGELATLLDHEEHRARELDVRALVECLFFGPCAQFRADVQ